MGPCTLAKVGPQNHNQDGFFVPNSRKVAIHMYVCMYVCM